MQEQPDLAQAALVAPLVRDLRGGLGPGTEYLQKPFTPSVLLDRVRELLTPARARP